MSEDESADPRAEERVGSVLADKWTLERLLGLGGMGAVYAAKHRNGARAAVKLLHPELARNAEVRERFLREGYAANKVEHRSTVKVLDDDVIKEGPDEGAAYLVMELLEGESLDARAEREPRLNEREVLEVLDTVLDVLEAAHAKGVVHRDLKPDNLFLAKDPETGTIRLKVLDFGLARIAEAARVTGHGLALGTPAFMSPEQAAGLPETDGRADLFALGATAFYVLTGKHVHEASTVLQQIIKMAKDPAPPLKSVAPSVADDVCAIIDRALMLERDQRYPDAAAMHVDVRAALERRTAGDAAQRTLITASGSMPPPSFSTRPPPAFGPSSEQQRKGGFPFLPFFALVAAGLTWMFWPRIRSRVNEMRHDATATIASFVSDASAPTVDDAGVTGGDGEDAGAASLADLDASALDMDDEDPDASALDGDDVDGGDDEEEEEEDEEEEDGGLSSELVDGGFDAAAVSPPGPQPHATSKPAVKKPATKSPTKKKKKKRRKRTRTRR